MGKTLLALKLANDWAERKKNLRQFKFAFLVFLRDFKGDLATYVKEELLPSHFDDKFTQLWTYCKENEKEIIFILDGYDELGNIDKNGIKRLILNYQDFQKSKVVVTTRPNTLQTIAQRLVIKGFSDFQMNKFIAKYFKFANEETSGRNLAKLIECDLKYRTSSSVTRSNLVHSTTGGDSKITVSPLQNDRDVLLLLRETEATTPNCREIARLLDRHCISIATSEIDFEGWSLILGQNFKKLKNLEINWRIKSRNPDQESSFTEATGELYTAFFTALRANTSITKIAVRATQDGETFTPQKIRTFFENFALCLTKPRLKEIELKEMKMEVSGELRTAVEKATSPSFKRALESVHTIKLDTYIHDLDLHYLTSSLSHSAFNLAELHLSGLELGSHGFAGLVHLIQKSKNLKKLTLSMNKEALMSKTKIFQDKSENNLTPFDLHTGSLQMSKHATQKSKHAFINQPLPDPHRELTYIFQDPLHTGIKHVPVSRGYYFIPGGQGQRLPLPICIHGQHKSIFHDLFCSIANSNLQSLTFLYPSLYLSVPDLVCLGDCLRKSKHLSRLKLPNLKNIEYYMPILLAVGGSNAIETLRIDSNTISVTDKAFQLAVCSLRHNSTLRTLSLAHWTFDLQDKHLATLYLQNLFSHSKLAEINLTQATFDLSSGMRDAPTLLLPPLLAPPHPKACPQPHGTQWGAGGGAGGAKMYTNVKIFKISDLRFKEFPGFLRKGYLLMPYLRNFPNLTQLDLSSSHTHPNTLLDDSSAITFFTLLATHLKRVRELSLANWEFSFAHYVDTCAKIGVRVKGNALKNALKTHSATSP
ncbi:hypothetical protein Pmani_036411 [Petrolisthes manimaculis]|uniref:NACHT domain-containing protein n=1 Tax=Petrolisthes manimaculis TaxID=1843537 RepID=A0AAE1NJN9_9EUCA|nr:hypothetical protein Pmani_036411 [Petrolisthes manimaculis]